MHMFLQWCTSLMLIPRGAAHFLLANSTANCFLSTCRAILSSRGSAHVYLPPRGKCCWCFFVPRASRVKVHNRSPPLLMRSPRTDFLVRVHWIPDVCSALELSSVY